MMKNKLCKFSPLLITVICATGMWASICILLQVVPFGNHTLLTGDLNGQYINYFAQMRGALLEGNGLLYSFQKSIGGSMLGIIAYYAASPFVLLYMLISPLYYPLLTTFVMGAKIILACLSMCIFLRYKFADSGYKVVFSALCYGFCSYALVYLQNFMWHDVLIVLPLICMGIDILLQTGKPFMYIVWLAVAIFVNFYIAYMACLFAVLYFLYALSMLQKKQSKFVINC